MRKRVLCACLVALSASTRVYAEQATQQVTANQAVAAATTELEPRLFTLKNGMQLIVKPDHRAPTAVHMLWLRVGSMDELSGTTGVAHVLEHMMFKGTPTVKAREFSQRVAALGGEDNAFTSTDYTAYYQQIPKDKLEEVMKLQADSFVNNQWPDDEFKHELEVVKEERRMRTDDQPRSLLYEQLMAASYVLNPYRNPIIGWMNDLDNMTPDDARAFYQQWYTPLNAAVVIAGDVQPEEALVLAEKYYGGLPAKPLPVRKPALEPMQVGIRRFEIKAPAEQANLLMAFKVPQLKSVDQPTESDWDALALTVLSAILDGNDGARLERNLINSEQRVADNASTRNGMYGRGPQLFFVSGVPAAEKTVEDLELALRTQIKRVADEGVTEAELKRVKTQWIAAEIYQRDSVFSQANDLGSLWAIGMPLETKDKLIEMLRKVTADQVKAVAKKYFGDDQLTVAVLNPQPRDPKAKPRTPSVEVRH